jgi:L-seryl-tRNA(Ser) seleniumtransferase
MKPKTNQYSKLPSIQQIDEYMAQKSLPYGKEIREQIKKILENIRNEKSYLTSDSLTRADILVRIETEIKTRSNQTISVINATGAIIHTNLGRSVLSEDLFEDIKAIVSSYTNLEFSLATGKRGARLNGVGDLLKTLTGAEEAVVVNNNAAAVLLTLTALAKSREVIISRGELVEIGGSFRIPEVIAVSGAILKEVGATNRTHLKDYKNAITENTAVLLKAHTSNYEIRGFTESVNTRQLAELKEKTDIILVEDIGSGALDIFEHKQLNTDPLIPLVLKDGADIVTISGDKLIGGPQAGIILGKKRYLDKIKMHPLYRALRCDKVTMLLLEKTLIAYGRAQHRLQIPTQRMLNESDYQVKVRAKEILERFSEEDCYRLTSCFSTPGGGSLPGKKIDSWGIEIHSNHLSENSILDLLRSQSPPIIGRIQNGKVVMDCRTILPKQIKQVSEILKNLESALTG